MLVSLAARSQATPLAASDALKSSRLVDVVQADSAALCDMQRSVTCSGSQPSQSAPLLTPAWVSLRATNFWQPHTIL